MSLYATYQNGKNFNVAYADSSSENNDNCARLTAACIAARAAAERICGEDPISWECVREVARAMLVCLEAYVACM